MPARPVGYLPYSPSRKNFPVESPLTVRPYLFKPFNEPRLNAKPCDRLRMRTKPVIGPLLPSCSMLKFANASSPVAIALGHSVYSAQLRCLPNTLLAYKFADRNWQSPFIDASGVRQLMFVEAMSCFKNSRKDLAFELILTLFSHSNSVHIVRNCVSVH